MITVLIYPLALGQPALFRRVFTREIDAADFEAWFRRLGHCHVRRA